MLSATEGQARNPPRPTRGSRIELKGPRILLRRSFRGERAAGLGLGAINRKGTMKRLVVVADNPLIVGAIRTGLRDSGAFQLLGYVDPRKTTAARITQAGAEVVLVDEGDDSQPAIALIQSLREQDEDIKVIALTLRMDGEWL